VADETSTSKAAFDLVVSKSTDAFRWWQQLPAWVLGIAAIAGGAALIAFPKHLNADQSRDAWAAVIVALVLAVLLSYRSAFSLNDAPSPDGQQNQAPSGQPAQPPANQQAP
jgi:hypothetical protein